MATPTLTGLPNELLDEIIEFSLPEGFESLALTCKRIYALWTRLIPYYNYLRSVFWNFVYTDYRECPSEPSAESFYRAFDLISRIAVEPIVARYMINADFSYDTLSRQSPYDDGPSMVMPDINSGSPVVALFSNSSLLAKAGLNWREYYNRIQKQLALGYYSQEAAMFVLTLLPNVKRFTLPRLLYSAADDDKVFLALLEGPGRWECLVPSFKKNWRIIHPGLRTRPQRRKTVEQSESFRLKSQSNPISSGTHEGCQQLQINEG
ncbi:hypothetical protein GGR55DRAFT_679982 [Xylaria sp. FL0064]|nr:hypothetical protein GGR55DRAFT_679982 [Xylaria sp. FL0064]